MAEHQPPSDNRSVSVPVNESDDALTPEQNDDDNTESSYQSSLLRSNTEILQEVEEKVADRTQFHEDGDISLGADDLNLYSQFMLYVIGKRFAYETNQVDTPTVTIVELQDEFPSTNKVEQMLFVDVARNRLTPGYSMAKQQATSTTPSLRPPNSKST